MLTKTFQLKVDLKPSDNRTDFDVSTQLKMYCDRKILLLSDVIDTREKEMREGWG